MKELLELSFSPWVIPFTLMLILCCLYWLLALFGAIDMDLFDAEVDMDSGTSDSGDSGNFLASVLKLVNATDVPLMLVISILSLCMWLISLIAGTALNPAGVWWIALIIWVAGFLVSCVVVALITKPLVPLFKAFRAGEDDEEPILGQTGTVVTSQLTDEFGQCRIMRGSGADALISCRLTIGDPPVAKGESVIIITRDDESGIYIAKKI